MNEIHDAAAAYALDALDPVELDVAGGRRTADPGVRTPRVEQGQRVRDVRHDLVGPHDADVQVGDERDRPATLTRSVVTGTGVIIATYART